MRKHNKKIGLPPGSVVFTGNKKVDNVHTHYLAFNETYCNDQIIESHSKTILKKPSIEKNDWYDIRGMHDTDLISQVGQIFEIHPLIQEAIVDIHQRPKFEEYENGIFITLASISFNSTLLEIKKEHVAIYFNTGFMLTVQETDSDLFAYVRKRINTGKGKIRLRGADYLAYALIDSIVDNYYIVLDEIEEVIEDLEKRIIETQQVQDKNKIHQLKKELMSMRKSVSPLREAISKFSKTENAFIEHSSQLYVRDLYEHTIQVMDTVDATREILNGLQDLFISEMSLKMNQVMQLLTLISVIFIPLTFLAGIYGMNFVNIPELKYENGYFVLLTVMVVIFIGMLLYFKRKKWL
ncbi:magnesium transporter [Maribacter vaceletii]|uniref:Magnesium transport protein CorA n=1 Tax=Maribacter vaceletii TaxID=1206816 RepID=A0A495DT21_9FLAO|nr:magnesium/cobalt transporter CorA [Maribacter vaceletii]RKR07815.1 magnesium transporter [Maribacter vaceletii]